MVDKEELITTILDKITYMTGYFNGVSSVLRSSGHVDPLALSGDFASLQKDMLLLQNNLLELIDMIEDDETEIVFGDNEPETKEDETKD